MENSLPHGWEWFDMLNVIDYEGGSQPPKKVFKYEPTKGYVRLIQIRDFGDKPFPTYIPDSSRLKKVNSEDLLIARYGGSSANDSLGRICGGLDGAYNVALAKVFFPEKHLSRRFVRYLLEGPWFKERLNSLSRSCQTGFNREDLQELFLPLPPIAEQHRIVAKLDAVMQKVESNKQRLDKIPKLLKRFRQSVLAAAVNGKLTEDWRLKNKHINTIFKNIENIGKRRKLDFEELIKEMALQGKSKPRKPENLVPIVKTSDDFPETWGIMTFSDISSTKQYSMSSGPFGSSLGTKDYREVGVPVVRGQNIQGGKFIAKNFVYISNEKAVELARSSAFPNDIVIVAVGAGVGNSAIIPNEVEKVVLSQNCNKFTLDIEFVMPKFILANLQVSVLKEQMDDVTTDTAREFLSLTNLKQLLFPIPPLEEQTEIVRRVEQLFAFADKLETRYTKAKAMLDKLPQSILAKAFRGELVAQNENDEPASVLLERIKAEKGKFTGVKKGKKGKKTKSYSIEEQPLKIAAEKQGKYTGKS